MVKAKPRLTQRAFLAGCLALVPLLPLALMQGKAAPKEVVWGIIGCGDVVEKKSGPALQNAPRSRVAAVMRRDKAKAEDFARRHGIPRAYGDVDALLADPEINAVYIATPPGSHLEIALKVAAAGYPLYVEKPAARTAKECETMERAFSKLPLFVAYYRRAYPRYVALRDALRGGRLGTIQSVSYVFARRPAPPRAGDWRHDAERSGGGKFVDIGSHALDLIDFLLKPLDRVRASARGPAGQVETKVEMHFRAGAGIDGTATWNFEASESEDLLVITGSEGSVRVPGAMNGRDLVWPDGVESYDPPDPVQGPLVETVVNAILDGADCPSTASSSTRTSRVIDNALGHYYSGRHDAFWARPETWAAS